MYRGSIKFPSYFGCGLLVDKGASGDTVLYNHLNKREKETT